MLLKDQLDLPVFARLVEWEGVVRLAVNGIRSKAGFVPKPLPSSRGLENVVAERQVDPITVRSTDEPTRHQLATCLLNLHQGVMIPTGLDLNPIVLCGRDQRLAGACFRQRLNCQLRSFQLSMA